ncbi:MAG: type III secretion system export apparatus subunit SctS [Pseudomonadota bacterium]
MNHSDIVEQMTTALLLTLYLSLPPIAVAAIVGVLIGFIQALTQIQEQTLSFGLKLGAVTVTIFVIAPWLGAELYAFCLQAFEQFAVLTR